MLPADAGLVARDRDLPGLRTVLDDERLRQRLRAAWPPTLEPPRGIRVTYLRYKPGTLLLAAVEVGFEGRTTTALCGAAAAGTITKLEKLSRHAHDHAGDLPAVFLPDDRILLVPITADRHLPAIERLPERVGRIDDSLGSATTTPLSYKPHRRLVVRIDVAGIPRAVAKVHSAATVGGNVEALRWVGQRRSDRLALPELIGADERQGLVVTSWMPGAALDDAPPDRRRATLREVGKLLGRLHQADPTGLPDRATAPERDVVIAAIERLRPELGPASGRALVGWRVADASSVPIHGDLSPDQVVHGPDGVGLIDLDRAGRGQPSDDLANWVAASVVAAPEHPATVPDALLEGYRGVGGPATDQDIAARLPWALLRRATEPFRLRAPDWPQRMAAIVAAAGAVRPLQDAS